MIPKDFNRKGIEIICNEMELLTDQISFLEDVLKKYVTDPPELDDNIGLKPKLEEWIEAQIRWRKTILNSNGEKDIGGLVKIIGKVGLADVTRIFEAMKQSGIISSKTEVSQIARIFFSSKEDTKSFIAKYNATKRDIVKNEANSKSDELLEFIKLLISTSFDKREHELNEIEKHILKIKNNLI